MANSLDTEEMLQNVICKGPSVSLLGVIVVVTTKINLSVIFHVDCHHSQCIYFSFHHQYTFYTVTHSCPFVHIELWQK